VGVGCIEARTFHKLGKNISVACEKKQLSIFQKG
jgi:hypothetical protein